MKHRPKGMTQNKCAEKANISQNMVSYIENGKDCKVTTYKKYLNACNKEMVVISKREG